MPPKSKAQKHWEENLRIARMALNERHTEHAQENAITTMNCKQFAFSILVTGSNYHSIAECFLENGIVPPCNTTYYRYVDEIVEVINNLAREEVDIQRAQMLPDTVISFDGSWDHRRQAKCCIVVAIDQFQKKNH